MSRWLIKYDDIPEHRCLDLAVDGLPCVPALGRTRYLQQQQADKMHVHAGCVEIVYCVRGGDLAFITEEKRYRFLPGHVFVSRPDEPHHLVSVPKGVFLYWCLFRLPRAGEKTLGLDAEESQWLAKRFLEIPRRHFEGSDSIRRQFRHVFDLHDDSSKEPFVKKLLMRNAIFNLLVDTVDAAGRDPVSCHNNRLLNAVENMRANPERNYSLAELAERVGLSPTSLNVAFKKMTGLPPHAFLIKCRIERAKEELAKPGCGVMALSERLGFRSFRHFSAQFKAETGCLPSKWHP